MHPTAFAVFQIVYVFVEFGVHLIHRSVVSAHISESGGANVRRIISTSVSNNSARLNHNSGNKDDPSESNEMVSTMTSNPNVARSNSSTACQLHFGRPRPSLRLRLIGSVVSFIKEAKSSEKYGRTLT